MAKYKKFLNKVKDKYAVHNKRFWETGWGWESAPLYYTRKEIIEKAKKEGATERELKKIKQKLDEEKVL